MRSSSEYKILIVEDEQTARTVARSYFERRWGARVWDAAGGAQALEIIRHEKPDVVLLDVMIEGALNGWQVINEIRRFDADVKIIVVTGQLEVEKHLAELGEHVAAVVQKPASLAEMEERVIEVLGGSLREVRGALAEAPATTRKGSYEARRIVHELSNAHNVLRMRCERFVLDHEDGFHKGVPESELVAQAVEVMKHVLRTVDASRPVIDRIRDL